MRVRAIFLSLLAAAATPAALAVPITFGFSGTVTQVPADDPGGGIGFGTAVSGRFTFDSAAGDAIPGVSQGSYSSTGPGYGLDVDVGPNSYALSGFLNIGTSNDIPLDQYSLLAFDGPLSFEFLLDDFLGHAFASDALPLTPPDASAFQSRVFHLIDTALGDIQIDGEIDGFTCLDGCRPVVPAPEPTSLALYCAAMLVARRRVRR